MFLPAPPKETRPDCRYYQPLQHMNENMFYVCVAGADGTRRPCEYGAEWCQYEEAGDGSDLWRLKKRVDELERRLCHHWHECDIGPLTMEEDND